MNRTAYIAGKISGLPKRDVAEKFDLAARELTSMGYHVVRPQAINDESKNWNDTVRSEIKQMLECDELHMLPDWQDSRGAQLERDIAVRLGMEIVYH